MVFTIFGSGIEQPHKLKVLYIMNNNVGIETICQRLTRTFRDWGFTDEQLNEVLNSTHLYPLDGEVRSAVMETQRQDHHKMTLRQPTWQTNSLLLRLFEAFARMSLTPKKLLSSPRMPIETSLFTKLCSVS